MIQLMLVTRTFKWDSQFTQRNQLQWGLKRQNPRGRSSVSRWDSSIYKTTKTMLLSRKIYRAKYPRRRKSFRCLKTEPPVEAGASTEAGQALPPHRFIDPWLVPPKLTLGQAQLPALIQGTHPKNVPSSKRDSREKRCSRSLHSRKSAKSLMNKEEPSTNSTKLNNSSKRGRLAEVAEEKVTIRIAITEC